MATQVAEKTRSPGSKTRWAPTASSSSNIPRPTSSCCARCSRKMGFPEVARHKSKNVTLHKQADCNFVINAEPGSYAEDYAKAHGPSACAMAFRVKDAKAAHERALKLGATNVEVDKGDGELDIPAIEGIGGSRLFFVDRYGDNGSIYEVDFDFHPDWQQRMADADSQAHLHRPPHPQREPRPDERLGRFLRAALQLPRDPLLRHRGQADRPVLQGDDHRPAARSASR